MKRKIAGVFLTASMVMCCCGVAFASETSTTPTLSVDSEIFGTTFNGQTIDYGDTCAVLTLEIRDW